MNTNEEPVTLARVERQIEDIVPAMAMDDVLEIMDRVYFFENQIKELKEKLKAYQLEWIKTNHTDIVFGTKRWYIGETKTTKCADQAGTLQALYAACQGDEAKVCEHLAANAWKHGACRATLPPEVYEKLFVTTVKEEVEEGKAGGKTMAKTLKVIDTAFLR